MIVYNKLSRKLTLDKVYQLAFITRLCIMHKVDENPRTELHTGKNAMEAVGRSEAKISASMTRRLSGS